MQRIIALPLGAALVAGALCSASSMSRPGRPEQMELAGRVNCPVVSAGGGRVYLQLTLSSRADRVPVRRPLNLCVVLDRSGSMADEGKMESARAALAGVIDRLSRDDIFSLVIYDDVVEVLRPAGPAGDRRRLHDLVEGIQPRGWTNLGGGMLEGFRQAAAWAGENRRNRVVLLSDGLANRGITGIRELCARASHERDGGVSLTTMGVGLEYNENLLKAIAGAGGGNYYFIERPASIERILRRELETLGAVVAQNTVIDLALGCGVCVTDVIGSESGVRDGHLLIPVGDVEADAPREFTVELELPAGSGKLLVATGEVRSGVDGRGVCVARMAPVSVRYSRDAAEIESERDLDAEAKAGVAVSTRGVERALQALDEGRSAEAASELAWARRVLLASPAASSPATVGAIRDQDARLGAYQEKLKDSPGGAREAKKAIQYDNYRRQRGGKTTGSASK